MSLLSIKSKDRHNEQKYHPGRSQWSPPSRINWIKVVKKEFRQKEHNEDTVQVNWVDFAELETINNNDSASSFLCFQHPCGRVGGAAAATVPKTKLQKSVDISFPEKKT